jgi:hypothetical protein
MIITGFAPQQNSFPHAAWLIAGMPPGRCKCKYCNAEGRRFSQTKLNNELKCWLPVKQSDNEVMKRQQAAKESRMATKPREQPLEEVYLKPVPIPGWY